MSSSVSKQAADIRDAGGPVAASMRSAAIFAVYAAVVATCYFETIASMVRTWARSDTYFHCFLILPLSAYLIFQQRGRLAGAPVKPFLPALVLVVAASIGWFVSERLGIQVGSQFFVVALLPLGYVAVAGYRSARQIAFPLLFLFFAVPFGTYFTPQLIDYTATITVFALQLSGIPVIRDAQYFSTSTGNFEVAAACSGIRYLLATVTLGSLYAHLYIRGLARQGLFLLLSILVPIVANGVRAYLIVLIAHFSDMRLAVGVDHFIYGWLFFGVVIVLLFLLGQFLVRRTAEQPDGRNSASLESSTPPYVSKTNVAVAAGAIASLCALAGPLFGQYIDQQRATSAAFGFPVLIAGYTGTRDREADWQLDYQGAQHEYTVRYSSTDRFVDVSAVRYDWQSQGAEVVNALNLMADRSVWTVYAPSSLSLGPESSPSRVTERLVSTDASNRVIWKWNSVDGVSVESDFRTKLAEIRHLLRGRAAVTGAIAVSTTYEEDVDSARETLAEFVEAAHDDLVGCLYGNAVQSGCRNVENGD